MSTTSRVTYRDAIRLALQDAMHRDERVVLLGEDVAAAGGVFKVTDGLLEQFGPERVTDTPISETGFVGAALGLALAGYRPVVEIMFAEFAACAWDQIVNQAATYSFLSAGQMHVPMVIRVVGGGGLRFGGQHSKTTESWYTPHPGLRVAVASRPQSAYTLLRRAIDEDGPVVFIEHKGLYASDGELDTTQEDDGKAAIVRVGRDATVVASLAMVPRVIKAAEVLSAEGVEIEVIDIQWLLPMDIDTVIDSVRRTAHLVTVEEQPMRGGWGSEIVAAIARDALEALDAAPLQLTLPQAPLAFSPPLEDAAIPSSDDVAQAVRHALSR
jgi:acetoin:2,6-dichlorophenolindophenol oxidoreductase subunit beta